MIHSYYIWTIGCQMNKADSERLESAMGQMGLSSTDSPMNADVIVLNSCVVRQSAEDKVTGLLTSLKPLKNTARNPILGLMGCMVGPNQDTLKKKFPYVDVFMQPQQYEPLIDVLGEKLGVDPEGCVGPLSAKPDVTAYIPIIHGCDKFCSFCIIPYRRGREISRTVDEVVFETKQLTQKGVKEITLLGQNVDSYGHDLPGKPDLGDLLTALNELENLERIRFLTSHPNDMSDHIIDSVANLNKVCEHINLPFQAGDDTVLNNMRRGYTNYHYRDLIDKIRSRIPNVSLSTDLIVGFCGETDVQFEKSLQLIEDIRFDKLHAASYSTRKGTISDRMMTDDVPLETKKKRLEIIETVQKDILTESNASLVGETFEILVEGRKRGKWFGRNRNDKLIYFQSEAARKGEMINVIIVDSSPWSLSGTKIPEQVSL